jgi:hypothetical protein
MNELMAMQSFNLEHITESGRIKNISKTYIGNDTRTKEIRHASNYISSR